jgi:hypothetical protein
MLKQPLLDQLQVLKLSGMRQALHEQLQMPDSDQLSFIDRLSLLIDREPNALTAASSIAYSKPGCPSRPVGKIWITSIPEVWIKPSSSTCSATAGSPNISTV